jgi:hypothetical protein
MKLSRRVALLLPLAATGCHLIDQSDFRPKPPPPPPAPPAPPAPPPVPPLVSIRFPRPDIDYTAALRQAVTEARQRKVDVSFEVQGLAPTAPAIDAQTSALATVNKEAQGVAAAIAGLGVDPTRIRMLSRTEPGLSANEVRVYVH